MSSETIRGTDCLLVIDVQNDFCTGGALAVPDADAVVPVINSLIPLYSTVVLTQDWHPKGHSSFASEHSNKKPLDVIHAAYGEQTLWPDHCIQGSHVQRVFCVGLATDFCVRFSAEDAHHAGFKTTVLRAGCRGIDIEGSVAAACDAMANIGIEMLDSPPL